RFSSPLYYCTAVATCFRTELLSLPSILERSNAMESDLHYPLDGRDLSTVTEIEIMHAAETSPLIYDRGTKIVRILKAVVVKIGFDVLPQEAMNMEYIFRHSLEQILVSRLYLTFNFEGRGHIVMDFVEGECLDAKPWAERSIQEQRDIILQLKRRSHG
ncbi:hypothetical protein EJ04DRAFT_609594, partial [Polyplosphaeria fusca]